MELLCIIFFPGALGGCWMWVDKPGRVGPHQTGTAGEEGQHSTGRRTSLRTRWKRLGFCLFVFDGSGWVGGFMINKTSWVASTCCS